MNDLISRQAAIEAVGEVHPLDYNAQSTVNRIKKIPSAQEEMNLLMAADLLLKFLDTDQGCFSFQMKTKDGVVLPMDVGYVWDGLRTIKQYAEGKYKRDGETE